MPNALMQGYALGNDIIDRRRAAMEYPAEQEKRNRLFDLDVQNKQGIIANQQMGLKTDQAALDATEQNRNKAIIIAGVKQLSELENDPETFSHVADFYASHPAIQKLGITRDQITPQSIKELRAQLETTQGQAPDALDAKTKAELANKVEVAKIGATSRETIADKKQVSPFGGLPPETLELEAQNYLKTGKLPPLYRDNDTKIKIMNRAAQISKESGDDASAAVIARQMFAANKSSLAKVSAQKNMVGAFEKTFLKNLDLASQLSGKVDRTGSPLLNKAIIAWKKGVTGDAETKGFINALTTARTEYAKILSGATGAAGITDAGRHEAEELFSTIDSPETLAYVADVAKQEAHNRMVSFDEQLAEIQGGMGNKPQPAAQPTQQGPVRVNTPQEAMALPSGTKFITPDGRTKVRP